VAFTIDLGTDAACFFGIAVRRAGEGEEEAQS
jgi:hypothetical protein